ncbi:hypothetical protein BD414DRAFT_499607 [Trametes punicea]|nr:hypothetical protein BD414DRAFT_499607 [Trametes punicea]
MIRKRQGSGRYSSLATSDAKASGAVLRVRGAASEAGAGRDGDWTLQNRRRRRRRIRIRYARIPPDSRCITSFNVLSYASFRFTSLVRRDPLAPSARLAHSFLTVSCSRRLHRSRLACPSLISRVVLFPSLVHTPNPWFNLYIALSLSPLSFLPSFYLAPSPTISHPDLYSSCCLFRPCSQGSV